MNWNPSRLLFTGMLAIIISCQGNHMKIDEKKLSEEILQQEKEEAERMEQDNKLADSLKKLPPGFRFSEDRSVDPAHLPVVIDIAGSLNNIRDFSLSDIASKITYIRIEKVPDSSFAREMKFKYYLMDKNIIAVNPSGILLYSREGKYLTMVVKNEFTGMEITANGITVNSDNTFIGGGNSVWANGNSLFYKYSNSLTGQSYIMEYDCSQVPISFSNKFDPEKSKRITGLGNVTVDLNPGNNQPSRKGSANGILGAGMDFIYQGVGPFLLDRNTYVSRLGNDFGIGGNYMMCIFNKQGDTLTTFTQFEKLTNFSKPLSRGTDDGEQYENNGKLFFRNSFNDTVFQVIPPNRLLPLYVLNLGRYKLSKKEGMDPDFDLNGKIIPESWAEGRNFIFITFTKDSYNCPKTRKNKQLKLYYALYSKKSHKLFIVKRDPYQYDPEILINNLDGGVPVWPSSYMIGNNDEILVSLKGSELKIWVKSEQFTRSTAPAGRKNELKKLAQSVSDDEDILMIVQ